MMRLKRSVCPKELTWKSRRKLTLIPHDLGIIKSTKLKYESY